MRILKANQITHPQYYSILELKDISYKWDNVPGDWREYADVHGINYTKLFDSMNKDGMKHPIMVRQTGNCYRKWQAGGRRIIWAKLNGYTHIGAYVLSTQKQVDEIYAAQYESFYK